MLAGVKSSSSCDPELSRSGWRNQLMSVQSGWRWGEKRTFTETRSKSWSKTCLMIMIPEVEGERHEVYTSIIHRLGWHDVRIQTHPLIGCWWSRFKFFKRHDADTDDAEGNDAGRWWSLPHHFLLFSLSLFQVKTKNSFFLLPPPPFFSDSMFFCGINSYRSSCLLADPFFNWFQTRRERERENEKVSNRMNGKGKKKVRIGEDDIWMGILSSFWLKNFLLFLFTEK